MLIAEVEKKERWLGSKGKAHPKGLDSTVAEAAEQPVTALLHAGE